MERVNYKRDKVVMARQGQAVNRRSTKNVAVRAQQAKAKAKAPAHPVDGMHRQGAITPEDFAAIVSDALGGRGWQKSFRAGTGFAQSTITRYLRGTIPIPQHVALICEMLQTLRIYKIPIPDAFQGD